MDIQIFILIITNWVSINLISQFLSRVIVNNNRSWTYISSPDVIILIYRISTMMMMMISSTWMGNDHDKVRFATDRQQQRHDKLPPN